MTFEVEGNTIYYALAALKGVGRQAVEAIVAARGDAAVRRPVGLRRPHQSARRQQARAGKPGGRRRLRCAGGQPRARVYGAVDGHARGRRSASTRRRTSGAAEFSFGGPAAREPIRLPNVEPWPPAERLQKEFDAIGFFLTGHPLDDYAAALKRMRVQS